MKRAAIGVLALLICLMATGCVSGGGRVGRGGGAGGIDPITMQGIEDSNRATQEAAQRQSQQAIDQANANVMQQANEQAAAAAAQSSAAAQSQ